MVIDCDRCRMRDVACRDCVVTVLLEPPDAGDCVELDVVEARAISVLAGSGLVPPLHLVPTAPPDRPASRDRPGAQDQPTLQDRPGRPDQPGRPDLSRRGPQSGRAGTYDDGHGAGASRAG